MQTNTSPLCRRAFTILELLVVLSIIAVLVSILLPMTRLAREQGRLLVCKSNLRQIGQGCLAYASTANGYLPGGDPHQYQGNWEWDLSRTMSYEIMGVQNEQQAQEGGRRNVFYCPFVLDRQDPDGLWNFTPDFRVTGYFFLLKRTYSSIAVPQPPKSWKDNMYRQHLAPEDMELCTDVTLSANGAFNVIYGGWYLPHTTSHIKGNTPLGTNILFLDGRVEWRPFTDMKPRCGSYPQFWF